MIEITDEYMDARLARVRAYPMLLLKAGPAYIPPDSRPPEQAKIIREHGRRNMQLQVEGKMPLVGPLMGLRPTVGMCVFAVPEVEARALMAEDPAVQAGIFTLEWGTWFGVPGDALPEAPPPPAKP
jgi:hypothetical protein